MEFNSCYPNAGTFSSSDAGGWRSGLPFG
jgi:hypothetical protein